MDRCPCGEAPKGEWSSSNTLNVCFLGSVSLDLVGRDVGTRPRHYNWCDGCHHVETSLLGPPYQGII